MVFGYVRSKFNVYHRKMFRLKHLKSSSSWRTRKIENAEHKDTYYILSPCTDNRDGKRLVKLI